MRMSNRNDDGTAFVDFTSHFNRIVIGRHWSLSLVVIVQVTQSKSLFNSIQFNSIHSFIQSSILLEIIVRDGTVFVDSISLQWKRHCCHLFRSDNGSLYSFIHSFIKQKYKYRYRYIAVKDESACRLYIASIESSLLFIVVICSSLTMEALPSYSTCSFILSFVRWFNPSPSCSGWSY